MAGTLTYAANTAVTVVSPSLAAVVALVVAPVVGLAALVARMFGRSGKLGLALGVIWRGGSDTVALVVLDVVGGALTVAGVLLFGITRPTVLVSGFQTTPLLAWAIVGAVGPLVSAGLLDRLPLRSVVDLIGRDDPRNQRDPGSPLVEVRFQAVQRLLFALYDEVRVLDVAERDGYSRQALQLLERQQLHFDEVRREVDAFAAMQSVEVPAHISAVFARRDRWPTSSDPGRDTVVLVETLLDNGWIRPVAIACRIAEQRKPLDT